MRHPLLWLSGSLMAVLLLAAAAAPILAPFGPNAQDILHRLGRPGAPHWLGTDNFGRDTLTRVLWGYRTVFAVSVSSVLAALTMGGTIGMVAAWKGGWLDRVLMRLMDMLFAFPVILLAIGVITVLGPGAGSTAVAIAVVYTPIFARTLRAPALVLRRAEFIEAARTSGCTGARIVLRHMLPNLLPAILVQTSLALSTAMLVEASLSFLGLGTQPPTPSLGRMLAESRTFLLLSPWVAVFSGCAILLAALGFNLLGDALGDRFDPRR